MINKLNKRIVIDPKFDASDWNLYARDEAHENVALKLNDELAFIVNKSNITREEVFEYMINVVSVYSEYGAYDTDCRIFLSLLLDEIFLL